MSLLEYGEVFWLRANEAREVGDEPLARAYDVLGGVCRMRLDPENIEVPLGGGPDAPLGPSFWPEQLPAASADAFEAVLDAVDDVWLRARLADVVHGARGRDHRAAERAADLLGAAARASWDDERERPAAVLVERALQLTGFYGPKSDARGAAVAGWEGLLDHAVATKSAPAKVNSLLVLGLKYDVGDENTLAPLSERTAERAEDLEFWHLARQVWATTSDWWHRTGDTERARAARVRAAATHEREADGYFEGTSDVPNSQAVNPLSKAVIAYREAGEPERAQAAHRRLQAVQQAMTAELARFGRGLGIDVEEVFTAGADAVRGLPLHEALYELVAIYPLSSPEGRMAEAADRASTYVSKLFFEDHIHNADGKLTARGRTLEDEAVKDEAFRMRIIGAGLLGGARRQLYEEHALDHLVLVTTLMHAPWVDPRRVAAYTRALLAGYRGDWEVMVPLLCPQIEHSVRMLLHLGAGKSTSSLDADGVQKEYGLSRTLKWPEAAEILSPEVAFALRVLLVHPMGHNLRNQTAHGLLHDGALDHAACEYLWWLTLRLCLAPPESIRTARSAPRTQ